MAAPMTAAIPPGLDLTTSYVLRFTALDPTSGTVDSSVTVSNATLLVDNLGGGDLSNTLPDDTPLFVPVPITPADASGAV